MNTLTAAFQKGFTLLEIVLVMSVLGVLATVGLQTYSYQVGKARVVDAVVLMDGVKTDVLVDFITRSRFPESIQEALASTEAGATQVYGSSNAVTSVNKRGAVDKYWYYGNDAQGIGWFAVELSSRALPGCDSDCQLHLGFRKLNNRLEFHCGLWDGGNFPAGLLPTGCKETCVSCKLSSSDAGEDVLAAALSNPVVPPTPTPAGSSGGAGNNNGGGSNNPSGGGNSDNDYSAPEPGNDADGDDDPGDDNGNNSGSENGNNTGNTGADSGNGSSNGPGNSGTTPGTGTGNDDANDNNGSNTGGQNGNAGHGNNSGNDNSGNGGSAGNGGNIGGGSAGQPLTPPEENHGGSHSEEPRDEDSGQDDAEDCDKPDNRGRGNGNAGRGNNNAGGKDCKNPNAGAGNNSGNGNTNPGNGKGRGRG